MYKYVETTINNLRRRIALEKRSQSYAGIARRYNVNPWHIYQLLNRLDYIPSARVRRKLGITLERPRNRRAINLDDPASAAATIQRYADEDYIQRLVTLLGKEPPHETT